jgi:small subunit ribosomal protein S20
LARHISALKRARQNEKRRLRNQSRKTRVKHAVREVRTALAQKDQEAVEAALKKAVPTIAKAAGKGSLHWRTAARKTSKLTRQAHSVSREQ